MFKVKDYVMYGITGVCEVVDIKEEKMRNRDSKEYYVLKPVYCKNTIIKNPVDNEKIVMRKIHTRDEVEVFISSIPDKEAIWIYDDKERTEKFKNMLKSGDCDNLLLVIKSIYSNKKDRSIKGKKLNKSDDEIMKSAERLINEEFATILEINPDEVNSYIKEHVAQ